MEDLSFYKLSKTNYRNSVYALNIALESKFTNFILGGENNRIVYSKNNFAFRKRSQTQKLNNLNLPFMNYKVKRITPYGDRKWDNFIANVEGIYIPEFNRKIKIVPITIDFESTFWCQRDEEMQFVFQELTFETSVETKITYYINILGQDVPMIGVVKYNLNYEPTYDEQDWLDKNKIHSIVLDFSVQTFYIKDNTEICIPNQVLLDFQVLNGIDNDVSQEELTTLLINHFTEENTEE